MIVALLIYAIAVIISAIMFLHYYFKERKVDEDDDVKIGADGVHDHTIDDYPTFKRWNDDD